MPGSAVAVTFEYECGRPGCRRPDDGLSPAGTVARAFFFSGLDVLQVAYVCAMEIC
jgi:hypothetical protein